MQEQHLALVPQNKFIYLTDNRKDSRVIRISDNKQFKWRKMPLPIKDVSKYPFYTLLEVGNNKISQIEWEFQEEEGGPPAEEEEEVRNNKDMFVIEQAQKLKTEDIQKKKKEMKPEDLIGQLIENNQQFQKRTDYSKQKYLKKKQRKYLFKFHAEPVSLSNVHNHYFSCQKQWICSIRWDMFALLLLHGGPYKRVLVGDQGKGLLVGAVLQRNASKVTVGTSKPLAMKQFPIVEQLNVSRERMEAVQFVEWTKMKEGGKVFDNVVLMGNYDFTGIATHIQQMLSQGAILTFYSPSLSPLEEVARKFKQKGYLNVKIFDSWSREYQVLKNRTHPMMSMDSCSGFLLAAIAVK